MILAFCFVNHTCVCAVYTAGLDQVDTEDLDVEFHWNTVGLDAECVMYPLCIAYHCHIMALCASSCR